MTEILPIIHQRKDYCLLFFQLFLVREIKTFIFKTPSRRLDVAGNMSLLHGYWIKMSWSSIERKILETAVR